MIDNTPSMTKASAMPKVLRLMTSVALVSLVLTGCSSTKKMLGFEKVAPDEFAVVARAPLAVPPQYQLRPPAPGTSRPQEASTRDQAKGLLTGSRAVEAKGRSGGEVALLSHAGADQVEPEIRALVNRELAALAEAERSVVDRIIYWRKPDPVGTILDPEKEQQRLRTNQALGESLSTGDTPIIKRRRKGILEGIF